MEGGAPPGGPPPGGPRGPTAPLLAPPQGTGPPQVRGGAPGPGLPWPRPGARAPGGGGGGVGMEGGPPRGGPPCCDPGYFATPLLPSASCTLPTIFAEGVRVTSPSSFHLEGQPSAGFFDR